MEEEEYFESVIKDEDLVREIQETTHSYYKVFYHGINQIKIYELELIELEGIYDLTNEINKKIKKLISQINHEFTDLFEFADENGFYWCNSTLKTYKLYMNKFFLRFKKLTKEKDLIHFYKNEINYFLDFKANDFVKKDDFRTNIIHRYDINDSFVFLDYYPYLYDINKLKIKIQNDKIIEFLLSEAKNEGYSYQLVNGEYEFTKIEGFKKELNIDEEKKEPTIPNHPIGIFKNQAAFELFNYLDENYISSFEKAKYVNFYHYFMDKGNILICTQLKYLDFIKQHKGIHISKITPLTPKFKHNTIDEFKDLNRLFELNMEI